MVNPDPRMVLLATARRWPILNLDVSPGVVKIPVLGVELQRLALQLSRPSLMPYVTFDIDGVEHIPAAGPAILVANHRSYFDPVALSVAIARSGRTVRFLGKKEVFDAPDRRPAGDGDGRHPGRSGDAAPTSRCRRPPTRSPAARWWRSCRRARSPVARRSSTRCSRVAGVRRDWPQMTKAPVIPIGLWGTEKVWPRSSRLPNVLNVTDPPEVRIRSASRSS